MKITQVEWAPVGKAAIKEYGKDDIAGLAAEMAYWVVFSIFPFFAFLAFLTGITGRTIYGNPDSFADKIRETLLSPLPEATKQTVEGPLKSLLTPGGGALSFGALIAAILAINSASTAVTTIMKAFNRAYGVEETRNFIVKKLTAVGLTAVLAFLLIGGSLFLSLGGKLADVLHLGTFGTVLLFVARIVGAILGISLGLAILYWKGPNLKQQFQWISPGSLLATITLLLLSGAFGFYVVKFGQNSYNKTYGTFAGIILFLFFLRLASTVILLGAEFNAEAAKRYDPEAIKDKVTDPRKQLPGEQPAAHPQALREAGVTQGQLAATNVRSAGKLAAGSGSPATAATAQAATTNTQDGGAGADYTAEAFDDPRIAEQLRELRERPFVSAAEQVRTAQARLAPAERARRARTTLVTLVVSAATAVGGILVSALRRNAHS